MLCSSDEHTDINEILKTHRQEDENREFATESHGGREGNSVCTRVRELGDILFGDGANRNLIRHHSFFLEIRRALLSNTFMGLGSFLLFILPSPP